MKKIIILLVLLSNTCFAQKAIFSLSDKPGKYFLEFSAIKNSFVLGSNHSFENERYNFGLNFGIYKSSKYFAIAPTIQTRSEIKNVFENTKLYFCCHFIFVPEYIGFGISPYFELCRNPKLINRMTLSIIF